MTLGPFRLKILNRPRPLGPLVVPAGLYDRAMLELPRFKEEAARGQVVRAEPLR